MIMKFVDEEDNSTISIDMARVEAMKQVTDYNFKIYTTNCCFYILGNEGEYTRALRQFEVQVKLREGME